MLYGPALVGSRYLQIGDGGLAAVERLAGDWCSFRMGTLQHSSPTVEASIPNGKTMVLGDIVLLRPSENAMGRVELLLDSRQAEAADRVEPPVGRFLLGRIMAGGLYGLKVALPDRANYDAGLFTAGKIWLVWGRNPRQRWQIDVPAGQRTQIRMHLEDSDKMGEPVIIRTPIAPAARGD